MIDDALPRESGAARPPNPKFPCALLVRLRLPVRNVFLCLRPRVWAKGRGKQRGPHRQEMYSGVATHFNVSETCQSKCQPCPLVPSLLGNIKRKARDVAYWTNPSRLATANEGAFPSSVRYCGINERSRTVFVSPLTAVVA
jgi:hypothetical protein